jgi:site-specific recombinase XerC
MTPTALNSAFTDIKKALGLEFTLHSLRHTQATRLGMEHVPISLISQRLGHSNISTTQNIYTHVLPNKQDITENVIEAMVDSIKEKAKKKAEEKESSAISCAPFVHPTSANTTF